MAPPIVLCQQTDDEDTALHWHQTLTVAGIEGLVIKAARSTYPTRADQRVWRVNCTGGVAEGRLVIFERRVATWTETTGVRGVAA